MNYYQLLRPLLFTLPPEAAHALAIRALKWHMLPRPRAKTYPKLQNMVAGLYFPNPVGMAAGFDKNAEVMAPLLGQGFGFVEVGTVTPKAQSGNPKPRMFRLGEDRCVINRLGFNNKGVQSFEARLKKRPSSGIIGANIGKNKVTEDAKTDYQLLIRKLYGLSDYFTVNISSPNTEGLRDLQAKQALDVLLKGIREAADECAGQYGESIPIFVKISPDCTESQYGDIVEQAMKYRMSGLIVSNTTIEERARLTSKYKEENGGLSGKALFDRSTQALKTVYRLSEGNLPLIGVGGISSGPEALAKIRAGASLVQIYTALVYQGFGLVQEINSYLTQILDKENIYHLSELVGVDA